MVSRLLLVGTFVVFVAVLGTAYLMLPQKYPLKITVSQTGTTSLSH